MDVNDDYFLPRYALAVLFFETSGGKATNTSKTHWARQDNWMTEKGYCAWYGVKCVDEDGNDQLDGNGIVSELDMSDLNLHGTIPTELVILSDLYDLDLSRNWLKGSIPSAFSKFTNLRDMYLEDNELKGPVKQIFNLRTLRKVSLARNDFTGNIPDSVGFASELRYLNLMDNDLTGTFPRSMNLLDNLGKSHEEQVT